MKRYAVFYRETDDNGKWHIEELKFDSFEDAVEEYIADCFWCRNVILADLHENKIIKQFSSMDGSTAIG